MWVVDKALNIFVYCRLEIFVVILRVFLYKYTSHVLNFMNEFLLSQIKIGR